MLDAYRAVVTLGLGSVFLAGGAILWNETYSSPKLAPVDPERATLLAPVTAEEISVVCHAVLEMAGAMRLTSDRPLGEILADFDDMPEMRWIGYMLYDLSQNYSEERDRQFRKNVEERCFRMFL